MVFVGFTSNFNTIFLRHYTLRKCKKKITSPRKRATFLQKKIFGRSIPFAADHATYKKCDKPAKGTGFKARSITHIHVGTQLYIFINR